MPQQLTVSFAGTAAIVRHVGFNTSKSRIVLGRNDDFRPPVWVFRMYILFTISRQDDRVYLSNIDVAFCMLPPECVELLIYADVIRGHVFIDP